jgi:hypothetical protein
VIVAYEQLNISQLEKMFHYNQNLLSVNFPKLFMGCEESSPKSWKIWNPLTHRMVFSKNVIFDETVQAIDKPDKQSDLTNLFVNCVDETVINTPTSNVSINNNVPETAPIASRLRSTNYVSERAIIADHRVLSNSEKVTPTSLKSALSINSISRKVAE